MARCGRRQLPDGMVRQRRITEDVRQQHSIELQAWPTSGLSARYSSRCSSSACSSGSDVERGRNRGRGEAASSPWRRVGPSSSGWPIRASTGCIFCPGLTGVALCAAASPGSPARRGQPNDGGARLTPVVLLRYARRPCRQARSFVAGPTLSEFHRAGGPARSLRDPEDALRQADRALAFNDESVAELLPQVGGVRADEPLRPARASLHEAARREPSNFLPWALLGDVAVRRGDLRQARRDYAAAVRRNPRDPSAATARRHDLQRRSRKAGDSASSIPLRLDGVRACIGDSSSSLSYVRVCSRWVWPSRPMLEAQPRRPSGAGPT